MASVADIAKDFLALMEEGKHEAAAARFNADEIVSYENMEGPFAVCRGKEAVKKKMDWWSANHEVHHFSAEGPYVNGDQFAAQFHFDVTVKDSGERRNMKEVGLYRVSNGKIVEERFFY